MLLELFEFLIPASWHGGGEGVKRALRPDVREPWLPAVPTWAVRRCEERISAAVRARVDDSSAAQRPRSGGNSNKGGNLRMRFGLALAAALTASWPTTVSAQSMEKMLATLAPAERAHQACILRGFDVARKDARLRGADRMKTSIFSRAVLDGTTLSAKGGAVRIKNHWYALSFSCDLTADLLKATSFAYDLGKEIPRGRWNELGLW